MSRTELSQSDEWETPDSVYQMICETLDLWPTLDVAANSENQKCTRRLIDGLVEGWRPNDSVETVWCNPPRHKYKEFVKRAFEEWSDKNINVIMLIPANTMSSRYWHLYVEEFAEYFPLKGRIKFLHDRKESEHPSRNAYVVVVWRKKI